MHSKGDGSIYVDVSWFRRDLRIKDNPLFSTSAKTVLPIFINLREWS